MLIWKDICNSGLRPCLLKPCTLIRKWSKKGSHLSVNGGVIWEGYIRYEISPGNPVINQIARSDHGIIWMLAPGKPGLQCTVCVSQAPGKAAGCRYIADSKIELFLEKDLQFANLTVLRLLRYTIISFTLQLIGHTTTYCAGSLVEKIIIFVPFDMQSAYSTFQVLDIFSYDTAFL